jgi:hydrogenase maturation protein HypF
MEISIPVNGQMIAVEPGAEKSILAVGAELKSSVCLLEGNKAWLSPEMPPLSEPEAFRNFVRTLDGLESEIVACDLHPDYTATRYARKLGRRRVEVQHHHAHIVSCMADNGVRGTVIGAACDGTGYGTDGAIWGCEVLIASEAEFTRFAHLDYFPLPGGDAAARDTWRPALALLHETYGERWHEVASHLFASVEIEAVEMTAQRLASAGALPKTSSMGRLFDAAAFLLGLCDCNTREAEAPMALESAAREGASDAEPLPFELTGGDPLRIDFRPLIRALVEDGRSVPDLARAFHYTLAEALAACIRKAGVSRKVALSGGCFANRLLLDRLKSRLEGMEILEHDRVPASDGGIALGQAVAASMITRKETD